MANPDRPRGLVPVRHLNGGSWNNALAVPCIPTSAIEDTHSNYYIGTPVTLADIAVETHAEGLNHYAPVKPMVDEDDELDTTLMEVYGVVIGFSSTTGPTIDRNSYGAWDPRNLERNHINRVELEADIDGFLLWVAPADGWVFSMQTDAAFTGMSVGEVIDINVAGTGDTSTGDTNSGRSNIEATAIEGGNFVVVGLLEGPDNDQDLANADIEVVARNPFGHFSVTP